MSNATQATIALFLFILIALIVVSLSRSPAATLFVDTPVVADQPVMLQGETELQPVVPTVPPAADLTAGGAAAEGGDLITHTVQSGEGLWRIAQTYDTTVDAILELNPQITDPDVITPGETLVIPRP